MSGLRMTHREPEVSNVDSIQEDIYIEITWAGSPTVSLQGTSPLIAGSNAVRIFATPEEHLRWCAEKILELRSIHPNATVRLLRLFTETAVKTTRTTIEHDLTEDAFSLLP